MVSLWMKLDSHFVDNNGNFLSAASCMYTHSIGFFLNLKLGIEGVESEISRIYLDTKLSL